MPLPWYPERLVVLCASDWAETRPIVITIASSRAGELVQLVAAVLSLSASLATDCSPFSNATQRTKTAPKDKKNCEEEEPWAAAAEQPSFVPIIIYCFPNVVHLLPLDVHRHCPVAAIHVSATSAAPSPHAINKRQIYAFPSVMLDRSKPPLHFSSAPRKKKCSFDPREPFCVIGSIKCAFSSP